MQNQPTEAVQPAPAPTGADVIPQGYWRNLISIVLLGVLVTGWVLYYTEWFEIVGGLLALGGLFSWLAFVSKTLPEARLEQMQASADQRVFGNPRTCRAVCRLGVALVAVAACFGSIELDTRQRAGDYLVEIYRSGSAAEDDFSPVRSGEADRSVRCVFGRKRVVHVKGYPAREVTVYPLRRTTLVVPDSFAQPVALLRPTPDLYDAARKVPKTLEVKVFQASGATPRVFTMAYAGQAVWVGCDDDVEVPARHLDRWQRELEVRGRPLLWREWARPRSLSRDSQEAADAAARRQSLPPLRLPAGGRLEISLFKDAAKSEKFLPETKVIPVAAITRWEDFPQVEDLDVK